MYLPLTPIELMKRVTHHQRTFDGVRIAGTERDSLILGNGIGRSLDMAFLAYCRQRSDPQHGLLYRGRPSFEELSLQIRNSMFEYGRLLGLEAAHVNLSGTTLRKFSLESGRVRRSNLEKFTMLNGGFRRMQFDDSSFRGSMFFGDEGLSFIKESRFSNCRFDDAKLHCEYQDTTFEDCTFNNTEFGLVKPNQVGLRFYNCDFEGAQGVSNLYVHDVTFYNCSGISRLDRFLYRGMRAFSAYAPCFK